MKKVTVLTIFMICTLALLPFKGFSIPQTNGYVGIQEDREYAWRINLNLDGLDNVMQNVEDLLTEIQARVSEYELFGLETMTIPEAMENISGRVLSYLLPSGWESLNISTLIYETFDHYITKFNSTFLAGEIPDDWLSLNYSVFVDAIVDGFNETLPAGWQDQPIPYLLELALNELNSTLLMGILPSGWNDMTLQEFLEAIIVDSFPALSGSFLPYVMMDQLLSTLYMMVPGLDTYTMEEFLSFMIPSEIWNMNLSYALEGIWYMINSSSPLGWDSLPISDFIDNLGAYLNYTLTYLDPALEGANMTTIMDWSINYAFEYSNISDSLPLGWDNTTIQDLAIAQIEQAKIQWTTFVLPQWDSMKAMAETMGGFPTTMGIKVGINHIYPEVISTLGGQRATPVDMTLSISMDMETWYSLDDLFSGFESLSLSDPVAVDTVFSMWAQIILNFTAQSYIVDPSTYSNQQIALYDQFALTQGLIVATNYNWETLTTEATIATTGNPDAYELSANWNSNGLLSRASLSSDGVVAISINMHSAEEIPGYEIMTLLIVFPLTIVGIIYYIRKKK